MHVFRNKSLVTKYGLVIIDHEPISKLENKNYEKGISQFTFS